MNPRERALAIATALICGGLVAWTYAISPLVKSWRETGDQVEALEEQRRQTEDLLQRAPAILEERHELEIALAPPGGPHDAIPFFLDRVRSLSDAAGVKANTLHYSRSDRYEGAFAELRFELRATAPLKQLEDFLVRLAADGQYVRVSSLSLVPQPDGTIGADIALVALAPLEAAEEGKR